MTSRTSVRRAIAALTAALLVALPCLTGCSSASSSGLHWSACGETKQARSADVGCARVAVPMDYDSPKGRQIHLALARVPATDRKHRIGSLFIDFGGPGEPSVATLRSSGAGGLFATLNKRFDIVGFDPRGVGASTPSIDCHVNEETEGIYSEPVPTPQDIDTAAYVAKSKKYVDACLAHNGAILDHVSTANVARDLDALRTDVGDRKLSYLGFSYGTLIGSTYASLFPRHFRALVLDGPVDADGYLNHPMDDIAEQTAGFEDALTRFEAACAKDQTACSGFGGADPSRALDQLVARAQTTPIPAKGYSADPRPVTGDDVREALVSTLYTKSEWGDLGLALAQASAGDGTVVRTIVDEQAYERSADGTYDPSSDGYFTITAAEQAYPTQLAPYLARGAQSYAAYPHFYLNSGYAEVSYGLWPDHDADAYRGPFTVPASSPTPLVVATTHDPATPYAGAQRLVTDLGNARLLTMDGDGHTAYGGNSGCIDDAVDAYLLTTKLPPEGATCTQDVPFEAPKG